MNPRRPQPARLTAGAALLFSLFPLAALAEPPAERAEPQAARLLLNTGFGVTYIVGAGALGLGGLYDSSKPRRTRCRQV